MKVYVVMGNSYPAEVFRNEEDAEAYCVEQKKDKEFAWPNRVHWRVYEFTLQEGK